MSAGPCTKSWRKLLEGGKGKEKGFSPGACTRNMDLLAP